jgi:hypothetical protein
MKYLKTFGFSAGATVVIWATVAFGLGAGALVTVMLLTLLEVTFSFDNAVVNAKLLGSLSRWWQAFFMTVGIFIAVFVVRFLLPVLIVMLTSGLGLLETMDLARNQPEVYAQELTKSGPAIDSFGGTFLVLVAAGFFLDDFKDTHWLRFLERRLAALGRYDNVAIFALTVLAVVMALTVPGNAQERLMVLLAAVCGIALSVGLGIFGTITADQRLDEQEGRVQIVKPLVGLAAFVMFCRLEVLDASFSFDGVIGAFALSSNIFVIMAGLGAGALWVRSLTVHLVRAGTLAKFRYLEHGAHWAIGVLGLFLLAKTYGFHAPEWMVGSVGLVFVGLAVWSSVRHERHGRHEQQVWTPLRAMIHETVIDGIAFHDGDLLVDADGVLWRGVACISASGHNTVAFQRFGNEGTAAVYYPPSPVQLKIARSNTP